MILGQKSSYLPFFFLKCTNFVGFYTISCRPVQTRNILLTDLYVKT